MGSVEGVVLRFSKKWIHHQVGENHEYWEKLNQHSHKSVSWRLWASLPRAWLSLALIPLTELVIVHPKCLLESTAAEKIKEYIIGVNISTVVISCSTPALLSALISICAKKVITRPKVVPSSLFGVGQTIVGR